jgi:subtilisin-like proprotein convertase family protein
MKHSFSNSDSLLIESAEPNKIQSTISVTDLKGTIRDVSVDMDIDHTWTSDMRISLEGPGNQKVLLVNRRGDDGDNFRETRFDDSANISVASATAPFRGTFLPEESLSNFNNLDPNGNWTLYLEDLQQQDGGQLNKWSLNIETGNTIFKNSNPVHIAPEKPNTIQSNLLVSGIEGMEIDKVDASLDIDHTWNNDLKISLTSPQGTNVILVDNEGGSDDGFKNTTFDDEAEQPITQGQAPFEGRFQPEEKLSKLKGESASGIWVLTVEDQFPGDGGSLNRWALQFNTKSPEPGPDSPFNIQIDFKGGLNANQRAVFNLAAQRWSGIITSDLPAFNLPDGRQVDDLLIEARGIGIDGPGRVLGQAGPTFLRPDSMLPVSGIMSFDTADLAEMEADGSLQNVIEHEMLHVIGIGTLWSDMGLLVGGGGPNPLFTGSNAMREYATLIQADTPTRVPVANTGGRGTRDGHWREGVFGNELMTGFLNAGENPLSRMTIASIEDLGYTVNYDAANQYSIPSSMMMSAMGLDSPLCRCCNMATPDRIILPRTAAA